MAGDPLLDFTNLDEVFAFMDQAVAKDCHEPRPFPKTDSERRDILESLARDRSALKTVLLQTLTTISLEDQALKSGFLPWVEPYSPKLEQLPAIAWSPSYVQFFNAEETRLLVGACGRCWKTIKQSHLFPAHWRQFQGKMFEPDVIRSLPSPQKEFAAHFLEQPRQRQIAVMKVTTQIVLRAASLEGLRELLEVLRDALRAIEGLRARLESSMATEPDIQ